MVSLLVCSCMPGSETISQLPLANLSLVRPKFPVMIGASLFPLVPWLGSMNVVLVSLMLKIELENKTKSLYLIFVKVAGELE